MAPSHINDPDHWREHAAEMRKLASNIQDRTVKENMLRIAAEYEKLAERAVLRRSLTTEPMHARPQPSWVEGALKLVPVGFVAGYVIRTDGTTGILPIFPANADDPKTPGSAFDRGQVLVVQLRRGGERVEAMSASVRPREPSDIDAPQDTSADLL